MTTISTYRLNKIKSRWSYFESTKKQKKENNEINEKYVALAKSMKIIK